MSEVQAVTFRKWLRKQRGRNDMIGDLAGDAFADRDWKGRTPLSLRRRILSVHHCDEAIEALDAARDEWVATTH